MYTLIAFIRDANDTRKPALPLGLVYATLPEAEAVKAVLERFAALWGQEIQCEIVGGS